METFCTMLCLCMGLVSLCSGTPNGAPQQACASMTPNHGVSAQVIPAPYVVHSTLHKYQADQRITVRLHGSQQFKGVLLQARRVSSADTTPVGTWQNIPAGFKPLQCSTAGDSVTHSENSFKSQAEFVWQAPRNRVGPIQFVATFVQDKNTFWTNVKSLQVNGSTSLTLSICTILVTIFATSAILYQ